MARNSLFFRRIEKAHFIGEKMHTEQAIMRFLKIYSKSLSSKIKISSIVEFRIRATFAASLSEGL